MSKHPIERLIDAGCTEILEAAGWEQDGGDWHCYNQGGSHCGEPSLADADHIDIAGMAAMDWLIRRTSLELDYKNGWYAIICDGVEHFSTGSTAIALIDAACAVKLNADEQERKQ